MSQEFESQRTLPSRAWSCETMAAGAEACRAISGLAFDKGDLRTALKVGSVNDMLACFCLYIQHLQSNNFMY